MKKLLFALLALLGVVAFAPKAEAGQYAKVWNGHCYTYVHKSEVYRDWPYRHSGSYYGHHRSARHYRYARPVRHYRSYDYCERPA